MPLAEYQNQGGEALCKESISVSLNSFPVNLYQKSGVKIILRQCVLAKTEVQMPAYIKKLCNDNLEEICAGKARGTGASLYCLQTWRVVRSSEDIVRGEGEKIAIQEITAVISHSLFISQNIFSRFSHIAATFQKKSSQTAFFVWAANAREYFNFPQAEMIKAPPLDAPDDNTKLFAYTAATRHVLGAVLIQIDDEKQMIAMQYAS